MRSTEPDGQNRNAGGGARADTDRIAETRENTPRELRQLFTWNTSQRLGVVISIAPETAIMAALVYLAMRFFLGVWPVVLLILFAMILAAALNPVVVRLQPRIGRTWAVVATVLILLVVVIAVCSWLVPQVYQQTVLFAHQAPKLLDSVRAMLAKHGVHMRSTSGASLFTSRLTAMLPHVLAAVIAIATVIAGAVVVLVMAAYMLIETPKIAESFRKLLPRDRHESAAKMAHDLGLQVGGYIHGQLIASVLSGIFSFLVLWLLGIPFKLTLAALACIMDVLPLIGVLVPGILAALVALTISPTRALFVVLLYTFYHQFESHIIIPNVYGNTLRVSLTSVIISVLIGGELLGLPGIVLALPTAAALPIVLHFIFEWHESVRLRREEASDTGSSGG